MMSWLVSMSKTDLGLDENDVRIGEASAEFEYLRPTGLFCTLNVGVAGAFSPSKLLLRLWSPNESVEKLAL